MHKMTALLFWVCALGNLALGAAGASPSTYAALAYSASTHFYAVATEMDSRDSAAEEALRRCGFNDCEIRAAVKDSCLAVAHSEDWSNKSFADGATEAIAKNAAQSSCLVKPGLSICNQARAFCSSAQLPPPITGTPSPTIYVALAFSSAHGFVATSQHALSSVGARDSAMAACPFADCEVVQTTNAGCLSAAQGTSAAGIQYFGFGHDGKTREGAQWLALDICQRNVQRQCTVTATVCAF